MSIFVSLIGISDFFHQYSAGKKVRDSFPNFGMYLGSIRSNVKRFKADLTCWAVGWKSVASQYVDFRPLDSHFGFFPPKMLRENIVSVVFITWSMYLWYIRSIERRFQPDFFCWAVGWKSVASQYVDFRPPDSNFGFFSPKMLRKNIVSMVYLLDLCICDVFEAMRKDLNPICLL